MTSERIWRNHASSARSFAVLRWAIMLSRSSRHGVLTYSNVRIFDPKVYDNVGNW